MKYEDMLIFKKRIQKLYDKIIYEVENKELYEKTVHEINFIQAELVVLSYKNAENSTATQFINCLAKYGRCRSDLCEIELTMLNLCKEGSTQ